MNCQEVQEKLLAHRVGELDDAAAAALHQHLETCAACRAAAEETERVLDLMRSALAAGPAAPAQLDRRHRNRVLRAQFSWSAKGPLLLKLAAVLVFGIALTGLLLPAVNSARLSSRMAGTLSNGRQIHTAAFAKNLDSVVGVTSGAKLSDAASERDGGVAEQVTAAPAAAAKPASRFSTLARAGRSPEPKQATAPVDALKRWQDGRDGSDRSGLVKMDLVSQKGVPNTPGATLPMVQQMLAGTSGNAVGGAGSGGGAGAGNGANVYSDSIGVNGTISGNGIINQGGNNQLFANGGGTLDLNGDISAAGGFTKSGSGTLVLNGANTYSGGTKVTAGAVALSGNNSFSGVTTLNGGTLVANNGEVAQAPAPGNNSATLGNISDAPGYNATPGYVNNAIPQDANGPGAARGGVVVNDATGTTRNWNTTDAKSDVAKSRLNFQAGGVVAFGNATAIDAPVAANAGNAVGFNSYYSTVAAADQPAAPTGEVESRRGGTVKGATSYQVATENNYANWAEGEGRQPKPGQLNNAIASGSDLVPLRTELPKPVLLGTPVVLASSVVSVQTEAQALNKRLSETAAAPDSGRVADAEKHDWYALGNEKKLAPDKGAKTEVLARGLRVTAGTSLSTLQPTGGRADEQRQDTSLSLGGGVQLVNGGVLSLGTVVASGEKSESATSRTEASAYRRELARNKVAAEALGLQGASDAVPASPAVATPAVPTLNDWASDGAAATAAPAKGTAGWAFAAGDQQPETGKKTDKKEAVKGLVQLGAGALFMDADDGIATKRKEAVGGKLAIVDGRNKDQVTLGDLAGKDSDGDHRTAHATDFSKLGRLVKGEHASEESEQTRRLTATTTEGLKKAAPATPSEPMPTKPVFRAAAINPWMAVSDQSFSTFSISVDSASFTLARRYLNGGQRPPPESVRTEEFVNFFDYAYAPPGRDLFSVHAQAARTPFCPPGVQLLKLGIKGRQMGRENRGANLTFLLDNSGSMNAPDRLDLARAALKLLVAKLGPADRVALITFSSRARLVLDFTPATEQKKILAALDGIQAAGFTHLEGGLKLAYQTAARGFVSGAANRVILMSDGVANVGADATAELLAQVEQYRKQNIFCSVFGLGTGTYDDTMLQALASKGNGTYLFMDSLDEARRVFVDELAATLNKIAADVKIQVEFNPRRVKQYRQLGYEQRQLKTEDFRNDAVAAAEVGSGQSVTALYQVELQGDATEPLGTVRVRGRNLETGRVEELERAITAGDLAPSFEQADVRFRLAAAAAQFAEILRGSSYAEGSACADVAKVLRLLALELHLDQKVQELLRLVNAAHSAPQAAE